MTGRTTLERFVIEEQRRAPGATGELSGLLLDLSVGLKTISALIARGRLAGALGDAASDNGQGERQKKLDVLANDLLLNA